MKVIKLNQEYLEAFKAYCLKYRLIHDESYLYIEDIETFTVNENDPTYILLEGSDIIGCISLMITERYLEGQKSRIRIYHCEKTEKEHYKLLLDAIEPLNNRIKQVELFIPNALQETQEILMSLNFDYYRTAYVMVRKSKEAVRAEFAKPYVLKPFVKQQDEIHYATIRNRAFAHLKGSETPITAEDVVTYSEEKWLLKDGIQILWHEKEPVGIVRMLLEEDETGDFSFVAPIALIPEYQGKGLGSQLLKAGIEIGQNNDIPDCMLSVNAENDHALALYKKVGFDIDMALSCFTLKVN